MARSPAPAASPSTLVQAIQPEPVALLVDDFEDGDGVPHQGGLNNWESFTYNPSGRALDLNLGEGRASQGSLEMPWRVEDTQNGQLDHPGAGVRSVANPGPIDLSSYSRLVFSHRFQAGSSVQVQCKKARTLIFQVTCRRLRQDYLPQFELSVPMSPTWAASVLPFSDLRETSATSPRATPVSACLAMADGVSFRVDAPPDVHDGECHSGTLWLDDIAFR